MNGFIMAAGFGSRLRPFTDDVPKPLFPAGGVTFLDRSIGLMKKAGIQSVAINLHHLGDLVRNHARENDFWGLDIRFSEEREILNTGGGAQQAAALLHDGPLLIVACDVVLDLDMASLRAAHRSSGAAATMVVTGQGDPAVYGGISVDREGFITDIVGLLGRRQEGDETFVNASAYIIEPRALPRLPGPGGCLVRDFFIPLLRDGDRVKAHCHTGCWMEGGTPSALLDLNMALLDLEFSAGDNQNGTIGRCVIGRNVVRGSRAVAGPHAVIADRCRLGDGSAVRRSVLLPGTAVAPGETVEDSLKSPSHEWRRFPREAQK